MALEGLFRRFPRFAVDRDSDYRLNPMRTNIVRRSCSVEKDVPEILRSICSSSYPIHADRRTAASTHLDLCFTCRSVVDAVMLSCANAAQRATAAAAGASEAPSQMRLLAAACRKRLQVGVDALTFRCLAPRSSSRGTRIV